MKKFQVLETDRITRAITQALLWQKKLKKEKKPQLIPKSSFSFNYSFYIVRMTVMTVH